MPGHELLSFPVIPDQRGNLTFIEGETHIPFDIKRVFYLYDVPGGESRAGHALKSVEQVIIAMSGSFDVVLDDGFERETITLNRSYFGVYVPSLVWRELENFSSGAYHSRRTCSWRCSANASARRSASALTMIAR